MFIEYSPHSGWEGNIRAFKVDSCSGNFTGLHEDPARTGQPLSFTTVTGLPLPPGSPTRPVIIPAPPAIHRLWIPRSARGLLRSIPGWFVVVVVVVVQRARFTSHSLVAVAKTLQISTKRLRYPSHRRLRTERFSGQKCAWRQAPKLWQSVWISTASFEIGNQSFHHHQMFWVTVVDALNLTFTT